MNNQEHDKKSKPAFDRETTSAIKGAALILMFIHHFFTFPAWWVPGAGYPESSVPLAYLCHPTMICVPVFAFLTGYLYRYAKEKNYRHSLKKIKNILIPYWFCFAVLALPAAFLAGWVYTPKAVALELIAVERPTMFFCWYVFFYCLLMLALPVLTPLLSGNVFAVAAGCLLPVVVFPLLIAALPADSPLTGLLRNTQFYFPTVISGFLVARSRLFDGLSAARARDCLQTPIVRGLGALAFSVAAVCAAGVRFFCPYIPLGALPFIQPRIEMSLSLDVVCAPLFVYCLLRSGILYWKPARTVLSELGTYSLTMWFLHCVFFNNTKEIFQPVLYAPRNPVLVLLWGLALCYFAARLVRYPIDALKKKTDRLFAQ